MQKFLSLSIPGYGPIDTPPGIPTGGFENGPLGTGPSTAENIIQTAISAIVIFIIILVLVYLIWGGFDWMLSHGDKAKIEAARLKILYAIVGLFVVFFSIFIVNLVGYFLGIDFFGIQQLNCAPGLGSC